MSKHTPGPWEAKGETISCATGYVAFATCNPRTIDETRGEGESWYDMRVRTQGDRDQLKIEIEANARLIAAAPDMLEALKSIAEFWNRDHNEKAISRARLVGACWHAVETAGAAIAKAEGEQP